MTSSSGPLLPPLTTLAVSPYQLGRRLARVMLDRIKDPEMPVTISLVPASLIVRDTTGPCPKPPLGAGLAGGDAVLP